MLYREIGEDLIPVKDYPTGSIGQVSDNIIYDLPNESTNVNRIVFGVSVWRNGYNPEFTDLKIIINVPKT